MPALDKCFGGYAYSWNWLRHYNDDATVSHNNENCNCLRASSPFKGYRGNLLGSGTRKEKREKLGAGKRSESSLARSLATRNGEVPTRQNISWWSCSFTIRWASQYTSGIPRENWSYLHTKKRPLWLYLSFSTHFNQPLTMTVNGLIKPGSLFNFRGPSGGI